MRLLHVLLRELPGRLGELSEGRTHIEIEKTIGVFEELFTFRQMEPRFEQVILLLSPAYPKLQARIQAVPHPSKIGLRYNWATKQSAKSAAFVLRQHPMNDLLPSFERVVAETRGIGLAEPR